MDDKWLNDFVAKVNDSQVNPISVNTEKGIQYVHIGVEFLQFVMLNRFRILQVGQDAFKNFLALCAKGQSYEALLFIYKNMDTQTLLDKYKENALKLAGNAQQAEQDKAFWSSLINFLGDTLVSAALGSLL